MRTIFPFISPTEEFSLSEKYSFSHYHRQISFFFFNFSTLPVPFIWTLAHCLVIRLVSTQRRWFFSSWRRRYIELRKWKTINSLSVFRVKRRMGLKKVENFSQYLLSLFAPFKEGTILLAENFLCVSSGKSFMNLATLHYRAILRNLYELRKTCLKKEKRRSKAITMIAIK